MDRARRARRRVDGVRCRASGCSAGRGRVRRGRPCLDPLYVLLGQFNTLDMGADPLPVGRGVRLRCSRSATAGPAGAAALDARLLGRVRRGRAEQGADRHRAAAWARWASTAVQRDWALLRRLQMLRGGRCSSRSPRPGSSRCRSRNPEFAHFFFIQEHLLRFPPRCTAATSRRGTSCPCCWSAPAPWLLALLPPGSAALAARRRAARFAPALFLGLWALVVFVFFSASGSKLPSYILPMFPALAVLPAAFSRAGPRRLLLRRRCSPAWARSCSGRRGPVDLRAGTSPPARPAARPMFRGWSPRRWSGVAGSGAAALLAARGRSVRAAISLAAGGLADDDRRCRPRGVRARYSRGIAGRLAAAGAVARCSGLHRRHLRPHHPVDAASYRHHGQLQG